MATRSYDYYFFFSSGIYLYISNTHTYITCNKVNKHLNVHTHTYTQIYTCVCLDITYGLYCTTGEVFCVICLFVTTLFFIPTRPSSWHGSMTVWGSIYIHQFYHFDYANIVHCCSKLSTVITSSFLEKWLRTWQSEFDFHSGTLGTSLLYYSLTV